MKEPKTKKSRKKLSEGEALVFLLWMVAGGLLGYTLAETVDESGVLHGENLPQILYWVAATFVGIYAQIILHEGGHLVCGLLTGYKFVSFRVGSWMWQKENGRIRLRRFSLAGTDGQCLLEPPELKDGKMPYLLYNLGGTLANLLTAVICGLLGFAFRENALVRLFFVMQTVVGLLNAALNGVPMDMGEVCNDGKNALSMGEDAEPYLTRWNEKPMQAFRKQMKDYLSIMATEYTVALLAEKDRLKAEAVKLKFEKRCETYPYLGEVESTKELNSVALGFHREIPDRGNLEDIN